MDIDIDMPTAFKPEALFPLWPRASMVQDGKLKPHNCGVHPVSVPVDPVTGLAAIPYKEAQALGYFKLDLLHLSIYDHFKSRREIDELLTREPPWGLLKSPSVQRQLFQLAKHGDLIDKVQPRSLDDVADIMALIRPQKRHLVDLYLLQKQAARQQLYTNDGEAYAFKKAHAYSYALVLWLQLHLIDRGVNFN